MRASLPVLLTPTRVEAAAACERRHFLADIVEKGKDKNVAGAFGNVLHAGVGALWKAREGGLATGAFALGEDALRAEWTKQGIDGAMEKYTLDKALVMFTAYTEQARRVGPFTDTDTYTPLSIEERYEVDIDGFWLSFQVDRSFATAARKVVVGDLKTVTRPDNNWRIGWYKSVQMKLYAYCTKQVYGVDEVEFFIEGLDKNVKPKVHEVMLPQWSDALLQETVDLFKRKAQADEGYIRQALDSEGNVDIFKLQEVAVNSTDYNYGHCMAYGQACPFLDLCLAEPEQRAALLRAEYHDVEGDY